MNRAGLADLPSKLGALRSQLSKASWSAYPTGTYPADKSTRIFRVGTHGSPHAAMRSLGEETMVPMVLRLP